MLLGKGDTSHMCAAHRDSFADAVLGACPDSHRGVQERRGTEWDYYAFKSGLQYWLVV